MNKVEKWQADFTDKIAAKYEKRVAELETKCQQRVERIIHRINVLNWLIHEHGWRKVEQEE